MARRRLQGRHPRRVRTIASATCSTRPVHSIASDSKGNFYTTETYEGKRVQKFVYKGIGLDTARVPGWRLLAEAIVLTLRGCRPCRRRRAISGSALCQLGVQRTKPAYAGAVRAARQGRADE